MGLCNFKHDFTDNEIEILKKYREKQNNFRLKLRFAAILLIAFKTDAEVISSSLGISEFTLKKWYDQYISKGIAGLDSFNYKPKKAYLNFFQINQAVIYVKFENPKNLRQIKMYIKEKFGVDYTLESVRIMIKKRGLKVIIPKVRPGSPPAVEKQKEFIKKYNEQKQSDAPGSAGLFTDAMHLIHQNIPSRVWGDPEFRPVMDTNSGRKRLNILGAYNPETHSFVHLTGEENCNADRIVEFFELVCKSYRYASKITLYADNARYYHSVKVKEWLKNNPKIKLEFLPCYAPNLNLIERFWKYTKEQLVNNKYYNKYRKFRAEVFRFLNNTGDHIKKLTTLMVEKFQIITS
jgi:transposase